MCWELMVALWAVVAVVEAVHEAYGDLRAWNACLSLALV